MIEAAHSVNFFISILDNGYSVLITINGQIIANLEYYNCQKKSILFSNKVQLILIFFFVPKMKKIVTKNVVFYSNN